MHFKVLQGHVRSIKLFNYVIYIKQYLYIYSPMWVENASFCSTCSSFTGPLDLDKHIIKKGLPLYLVWLFPPWLLG